MSTAPVAIKGPGTLANRRHRSDMAKS